VEHRWIVGPGIALLLQCGRDLLDVLCVLPRTDEQGVLRLDDDEVGDAERADQAVLMMRLPDDSMPGCSPFVPPRGISQ